MYQQLNVRVPVELFRKLKAKAALEGKSLIEVIVGLIRKYVADDETDS